VSWQLRVRAALGSLTLDVEIEGAARPLVLAGPNGAGKTTLLRIIAGARRPSAGLIRVGDRTLFDSSAGIDLPPEERRVGYVPQGYALFPHLDVADNVAFGLLARKPVPDRGARRSAAESMLGQMDCPELAGRMPGSLSGGERQRVALARALMTAPDMLLLDEPLAALDAIARRQLRGFLARRIADLGRPTIVVTHDVRDARALGAEVVFLESGRVVQAGAPEHVVTAPATEFVSEFLGAGEDIAAEGATRG
jgi:ABC-type sulfate/molybdate transport systems ATPase subunit